MWIRLILNHVNNSHVNNEIHLQPIADRVAQHLEIIAKNFQFSTRCTRIIMGGIHHLFLGTNRKSHVQNSGE